MVFSWFLALYVYRPSIRIVISKKDWISFYEMGSVTNQNAPNFIQTHYDHNHLPYKRCRLMLWRLLLLLVKMTIVWSKLRADAAILVWLSVCTAQSPAAVTTAVQSDWLQWWSQGHNYKKTSYDFSQDHLKLDHTSIVSSQLTGTIPCIIMIYLTIIIYKLITKSDLRTS